MKAIVLPNKTYQVPPKVLSKALLIKLPPSSTNDSPQDPGIRLPKKKISQKTKLMQIPIIDICVAALGPKCLVMTSIVRKANQDTMIPESNANHDACKSMLLLASRFIEKIEMTKRTINRFGTDLSSSFSSMNSDLIFSFIFCLPMTTMHTGDKKSAYCAHLPSFI